MAKANTSEKPGLKSISIEVNFRTNSGYRSKSFFLGGDVGRAPANAALSEAITYLSALAKL